MAKAQRKYNFNQVIISKLIQTLWRVVNNCILPRKWIFKKIKISEPISSISLPINILHLNFQSLPRTSQALLIKVKSASIFITYFMIRPITVNYYKKLNSKIILGKPHIITAQNELKDFRGRVFPPVINGTKKTSTLYPSIRTSH
jgi:hypothetical protein